MSATITKRKGIGGHQRPGRGLTNEWLTPPEIVAAIGPFDLDPCSPAVRPWDTAARHFAQADDGLGRKWSGRVWLNPPYGDEAEAWLKKLADHGDGISILFARTETRWFFEQVWWRATALLFIKGRLHFYRPNGERAKSNAGGPTVLVAYGFNNADVLRNCTIAGHYVELGGAANCKRPSTDDRRVYPERRAAIAAEVRT